MNALDLCRISLAFSTRHSLGSSPISLHDEAVVVGILSIDPAHRLISQLEASILVEVRVVRSMTWDELQRSKRQGQDAYRSSNCDLGELLLLSLCSIFLASSGAGRSGFYDGLLVGRDADLRSFRPLCKLPLGQKRTIDCLPRLLNCACYPMAGIFTVMLGETQH